MAADGQDQRYHQHAYDAPFAFISHQSASTYRAPDKSFHIDMRPFHTYFHQQGALANESGQVDSGCEKDSDW